MRRGLETERWTACDEKIGRGYREGKMESGIANGNNDNVDARFACGTAGRQRVIGERE